MMAKPALWMTLLFILALLFGLLVNLPAVQLLRFIELPPGLAIKGLTGDITDGRLERLNFEGFELTDIDFELQPGCLFNASICYRLRSDDKQLLATIRFNPLSQRVELRQSQILLASELLNNMPGLIVKPSGEFLIYIENLSYAGGRISELEGRVDWMDAGIQGEDQPLGNFRAGIKREADKLAIKLADRDSLLSVSGGIDINWQGRLTTDVRFETQPSLNQSVKTVLELTAKKTGLNRFELKRTAQLTGTNLAAFGIITPVE